MFYMYCIGFEKGYRYKFVFRANAPSEVIGLFRVDDVLEDKMCLETILRATIVV